jgi:aspartate/glutamate racemase
LAKRGLVLASHDAPLQRRIEALIETLKLRGASESAQRDFVDIVDALTKETGAQHLILACTELAMLDPPSLAIPSTDSAAALARHTIRLAKGSLHG